MLVARNILVKYIDQISVLIELRVQQARQKTKQTIAERGIINAIHVTRVLNLNLGERGEIWNFHFKEIPHLICKNRLD